MAKLSMGVIVALHEDIEAPLARVKQLGFTTCQIACWQPQLYTKEQCKRLRSAMAGGEVSVAALWTGYTGPLAWNLTEGPSTLGLVPETWRRDRIRDLKRGARFAADCGIKNIATHVGFIPENPADPQYKQTVRAVREVARYCEKLGIEFWFETGQETPVTLLRAIQDIGTPNLGINLDPANLILYGKANPVDALDVFGRHVRCVHAKDGLYPTDGRKLGKEVPLGKGKVDFPTLIAKLWKLGFRGSLIIEREISGPRQTRDIRRARKFLEKIIAALPRGRVTS